MAWILFFLSLSLSLEQPCCNCRCVCTYINIHCHQKCNIEFISCDSSNGFVAILHAFTIIGVICLPRRKVNLFRQNEECTEVKNVDMNKKSVTCNIFHLSRSLIKSILTIKVYRLLSTSIKCFDSILMDSVFY